MSAWSRRISATPADPVKPVSQLSRSERFGDIFALVLVGARHQEAVEVVRRQPFSQQRDARLPHRGIAFGIEALEHSGSPCAEANVVNA